MPPSKKLSIIIPTKNRYQCLFKCIDNIEPYLSDESEIVIQDNSDSNDDFIHQAQFSDRVKYFYNKVSLPISDNTELAITHATGEYVLFIGDDDFIHPDIEKIISYIDEAGINCLTYDAGNYWWDTVVFQTRDRYRDKKVLTLPKIDRIHVRELDTKRALKNCLKRGAIDYLGLPRFYHGVVKREILEVIKIRTGKYVNASCPDMAFSISLSLVLSKFHHVNFPVTIFGASKNSGGGMTAQNTHYQLLESAVFLRAETVRNWSEMIPRIWSEKTIYPQSTLEVLSAFNTHKTLNINFYPLYAAVLVYEPHIKQYLERQIAKLSKCQYVILGYHIFKKKMGLLYSIIKKIFPRKNMLLYKNIEVDNIPNTLLSIRFQIDEENNS